MNPAKRAFLLQSLLLIAPLAGVRAAFAQQQQQQTVAPQPVPLIMGEAFDEAGRPKPMRPWQRALLDYLEKELNLRFEVRSYPWPRAERNARNGDGLIFGLPKNGERERALRYSEAAVSSTLWLVTRSDATFPFEKLADLHGKTIGAVRGYGYGDEFERARAERLFKVEDDLPSRATRLQRLLLKRVDAVLLYQTGWQSAADMEAELRAFVAPLVKDMPLPPGVTVSVLPVPVQVDAQQFFAIARNRDAGLIDRINAALLKQQKQASLRQRRS